MGKDPAVLFYTSDFLSGTAYFSMEQRGQYITLLCEQHQNGNAPEHHLIAICGSLDSPVAKKFIKDSDGTYYNEKMKQESDRRKAFTDSRKKSAQSMHVHKHIKERTHERTHMRTHEHTHGRMETITRTDTVIGSVIKEGDARGRFERPTLEEIKAYITEKGYSVDPEKFFNYYESNGWRVGKNPMKNWRAAINTWTRNDSQQIQLSFSNKGANNVGTGKTGLAIDAEERERIRNKYAGI